MSTCVIELNDIAVTARSVDAEAASSPAYALIQDNDLVIGAAAQSAARLTSPPKDHPAVTRGRSAPAAANVLTAAATSSGSWRPSA
jgi:hypothetical protein